MSIQIKCKECKFWDKTGNIDVEEDGTELRMCYRGDFPTSENEGCTFDSVWEYLLV